MEQWRLGIDLGGTDMKLGIVDESGQIVRSVKKPTNASAGPENVIRDMGRHARELIQSDPRVRAIGLGCPGPLSSRLGIVFETPNLKGWRDVPVRDILEEHVQLPVTLNNDANAAAWGEFWAGAGRDANSMILFTLGTGVGGGIILDNRLYCGPDDTAGELGHMIINFDGPLCGCGNHGCIEAYANANAFRREVLAALDSGRPTSIRIPPESRDHFGVRVVYDAARDGDEFALELFRKIGFYLGVAAATVINTFNPEMIVYGGAISNAWEFLSDSLIQTARDLSFDKPGERAKIVRATLGNPAGIIGAAGLANPDPD